MNPFDSEQEKQRKVMNRLKETEIEMSTKVMIGLYHGRIGAGGKAKRKKGIQVTHVFVLLHETYVI